MLVALLHVDADAIVAWRQVGTKFVDPRDLPGLELVLRVRVKPASVVESVASSDGLSGGASQIRGCEPLGLRDRLGSKPSVAPHSLRRLVPTAKFWHEIRLAALGCRDVR